MTELKRIFDKIENRVRLSDDDALFLYKSTDLIAIGKLANQVNESINQENIFFNINRHINPTNICVMDCKFCSFAKKIGDPEAYAYSHEQILEKAEQAYKAGASEVHMVGGLHPRWKLSYYTEILEKIRHAFPSLHIKGFTAVEIDWLAKKSRLSHAQTLDTLRKAGLDSLPGGGAEILSEPVRQKITAKLSSEQWLNIHKTAHKMGLKSNCTMLYGHVENYEDRVTHLHKLRNLQDETGGFNAFIPLSFQPYNNEMGISRFTLGSDDLKNIAVARLYLDNFLHIKAYWMMLGHDIAQLATSFGANDLDGTIAEEKISNMAGSRSGMHLSKKNLEDLIIKAKKNPQQRDTLYKKVASYKSPLFSSIKSSKKEHEDPKHLINLDQKQLTTWLNEHTIFDLYAHAKNTGENKTKSQHIGSYSLVHEIFCDNEKDPIETLEQRLKQKKSTSHDLLSKTIKIELSPHPHSNLESFDWDDLIVILLKCQKKFPSYQIIVSGLQNFWQIIQARGLSLAQATQELQRLNVRTLESSYYESEHSLTHSEIYDIHKSAHLNELPTVAKVELNVPPNATSPLWESFISKLKNFYKLQTETKGLIAVSIEAAKNNFISSYEYFCATMIARVLLPNVPNIIAPFTQMPVSFQSSNSNDKKHIKKSIHAFPQEKFASLAFYFGANDLGHISTQEIDEQALHILCENINSLEIKEKTRDPRFFHL